MLGAGGVGGYFGGRLAVAGHDVAMVARGSHLAALQEHGLRVRSVMGHVDVRLPVAEDPAVFGPVDVVLFCVKAYDTASAAAGLTPVLRPETAVVSLQNGVDNEDLLGECPRPRPRRRRCRLHLLDHHRTGCRHAYRRPSPDRVRREGRRRTDRVEQLLAACLDAGIDADIAPDISAVLWTKFAFICATAGMTASVRLPLGDIRDSPPAWAMFRQIVTEVVDLARLEGVALRDGVVEQQVGFAAALPAESYWSLHHDLVTGRRMELDALHGSVVRRAERYGLPVPACAAVEAILTPWARRDAGPEGKSESLPWL